LCLVSELISTKSHREAELMSSTWSCRPPWKSHREAELMSSTWSCRPPWNFFMPHSTKRVKYSTNRLDSTTYIDSS